MSKIKINLIFQTVYQILIVLTPLITSPYVSRVLGAEGLGEYSYTFSIVNYFMIFALLGTSTYGNRVIAQVRDDKKKLSRSFWEIYSLQLISTGIAVIGYLIYLASTNDNISTLMYIQAINILACFFNINWFYFGIEQFKITVTRSIVIKILSIISIFIFVKDTSDLWKYILILSLTELLNQALLLSILHKYIIWVKPTLKGIFKHLKPNLILFIPAIAYSLNHVLDKLMIGWLSDYNNNGFYYNSEKLISIPTGIITGFGVVMLPRISNLVGTGKHLESRKYFYNSINLIAFASIALSFGILSISEDFVPLFFGEGYDTCTIVINIMCFTIIFKAMADVLRTQYLIPHQFDKIYSIAMFVGAIVNVVINMFIIEALGAIGAAISTLIAEFIIFVIQVVFVEKRIPIIKNILIAHSMLLPGIGMYFSIQFLKLYYKFENIILKLSVEIIVGAFVYLIFSSMLGVVLFRKETKKIGKLIIEQINN